MSDSDDLTKVHIDLPNHWWFKGESMWAKSLGNDLYEIESIPFCAYGLNYGDVVHATPDGPDLKPEIRSVVRRSGNQTLRIIFSDAVSLEQQQPILAALTTMGTELERANAQFVCVNVPHTISYASVRDYIGQQEAASLLEYETCEERVPGSFDDRPDDEGSKNKA